MIDDLQVHRQSASEVARTNDVMALLPLGRKSILDVGARDGHFSRLFTGRFETVVALDLIQPGWDYPGVETVQGDITKLEFPDRAFDCVFCAEVLEHIPDLHSACRELQRVCRHDLVIGVPFRQDLRFGRTTCRSCRAVNPPWGHVNSFTLQRLQSLFPDCAVKHVSYVGETRAATNPVSAFLMDVAGNPWGVYNQKEPCLRCGQPIARPPARRGVLSRACSFAAHRINQMQLRLASPHANWIHVLFEKR